jgi:hypothetical protein
MDVLQQLARLHDLVGDRTANIAEMRNIISSVTEQHESLIAEAVKLKEENAKLVAAQPLPPPNLPNYGSLPRIKGRMEQ